VKPTKTSLLANLKKFNLDYQAEIDEKDRLFKEEVDDFMSKVSERKVEIFAKMQATEATFLREFDESPNIEKRVLGRLFCKVDCHEALRCIKWADIVGTVLVITLPRVLLC